MDSAIYWLITIDIDDVRKENNMIINVLLAKIAF